MVQMHALKVNRAMENSTSNVVQTLEVYAKNLQTQLESKLNNLIECTTTPDRRSIFKEKLKHIHNARTILLNSNATPILTNTGKGFTCCFCLEEFSIPKDLRDHTLKNHNNSEKEKFMGNSAMSTFVVRLDITGLKCTICDENFEDLQQFINHLIIDHEKLYHTDIKNHVVPFKFDSDKYTCVICHTIFERFKVLSEHMNLHYRNYVCEICDAAFVNSVNLGQHKAAALRQGELSHQIGEKILEKRKKQHAHEKNVHLNENRRNKCYYCDERFAKYSDRNDHMVQMHAIKVRRAMKCSMSKLVQRSEVVKNNLQTQLKSRPRKLKNESTTTPNRRSIFKEKLKHIHNARTILLNSNATPIRTYTGKGFTCSFCSEEFSIPKDLRDHTLKNHNNSEKEMFMDNSTMSTFVVRLDITGLKCTICDENFVDLQQFINHLIIDHEILYHTDIKNHVVPFKFDSDEYTCVLCPKSFERFKVLLEHMSSHYRNYVCEICDASFVNSVALRNHRNAAHKQGEFCCNYCAKVFGNVTKKRFHEKIVHLNENLRNKCHYCNEKFAEYSDRNEHMVQMHGVKRLILKCKACDRTFTNRKILTVHIKRDHLMERNFECDQCDATFFSGRALKMHMLKHTGVKKYGCEVCFKFYGRRSTLKQHMRIHANDRRFKCEHCGQAFVQKCSWRSHMRSKHGEIV